MSPNRILARVDGKSGDPAGRGQAQGAEGEDAQDTEYYRNRDEGNDGAADDKCGPEGERQCRQGSTCQRLVVLALGAMTPTRRAARTRSPDVTLSNVVSATRATASALVWTAGAAYQSPTGIVSFGAHGGRVTMDCAFPYYQR